MIITSKHKSRNLHANMVNLLNNNEAIKIVNVTKYVRYQLLRQRFVF